MSEGLRRFERQTERQQARRTLPWPEKIRMAEKIRESIKQLRAAPFPQKSRHIPTEHGP